LLYTYICIIIGWNPGETDEQTPPHNFVHT
jgi:hypothetical protein